MKFIHIMLSIILLFIACNTRNQEFKKILKEWINKEIIFPELEVKYIGRDTLLPDLFNHRFKILHYVDTIGCTNCRLQLFDWKLYMKELDSLSIDIEFIFVVFSNDYEEFEAIQQANHFTHPVIYDYNGLLNDKNNFPTYPYPLHTFLLDRNNKVLAIGNPIDNDLIRHIFSRIIQDKVLKE